MSSERGRNPAAFALIAFGGGGPTHVAALAADLGVTDVVVSVTADSFSAVGLHACEVRRDVRQNFHVRLNGLDPTAFAPVKQAAVERMRGDGLDRVRSTRLADMRFVGQSRSLSIELPTAFADADLAPALRSRFIDAYQREYAHCDPSAPVEVAALRIRIEGSYGEQRAGGTGVHGVAHGAPASAYFGPEHGRLECERISEAELAARGSVSGPLLVQIGAWSRAPAAPGNTAAATPMTRSYELLCGQANVYVRSDRRVVPSWGLEGGDAGTPGTSYLIDEDGRRGDLAMYAPFVMRRGQKLTWQGAGSSGWGDPALRSPEDRARDVREERWP